MSGKRVKSKMRERTVNWCEPKKGLMEGWGGQVQEDPLVAGERGEKAAGVRVGRGLYIRPAWRRGGSHSDSMDLGRCAVMWLFHALSLVDSCVELCEQHYGRVIDSDSCVTITE